MAFVFQIYLVIPCDCNKIPCDSVIPPGDSCDSELWRTPRQSLRFPPFFDPDLRNPTNSRIFIVAEKRYTCYSVFVAITNLRLYVTHNISTCMNQ